ncbi:MAG: hypothetical protein JST29_05545 [Bacteroidetes bacterium]|nr:hypothetical protein [Bacteroidota bacterium]
MDILNSITQGIGAYLGAKEAAANLTPQQQTTGIILIIVAFIVIAVLLWLLFKK